MSEELCGCGKPVRYETPTGMACNKYMRCVTPDVQAAVDAALESLAQICNSWSIDHKGKAIFADEFSAYIRSRIGTNPLAELQAKIAELEDIVNHQTYRDVI